MYNFTLSYFENVEKMMLDNKNKFGETDNKLLIAQDENIYRSMGFYFTTPDCEMKTYQLLTAITSFAIATHPHCSSLKKMLLTNKFLSNVKSIERINFSKIKTKNLFIFSSEAWAAVGTDDENLNDLPPRERHDRSEVIITVAYENESKESFLRISEIEKQDDKFVIGISETTTDSSLSGPFDEILKHEAFNILNDIELPEKLKKYFLEINTPKSAIVPVLS